MLTCKGNLELNHHAHKIYQNIKKIAIFIIIVLCPTLFCLQVEQQRRDCTLIIKIWLAKESLTGD